MFWCMAGAPLAVNCPVSGRDVAELGPIRRNRWRRGQDIAAIFAGPADPDWSTDRAGLDDTPADPFSR